MNIVLEIIAYILIVVGALIVAPLLSGLVVALASNASDAVGPAMKDWRTRLARWWEDRARIDGGRGA
jgi:hypothetical protein